MNPALRHSAAHVFVESLAAPRLEADDAHHLLRVLRLRAGAQITCSDGAGSWMVAELGDEANVVPAGELCVEPPPRPLAIVSAVAKGDRPEWVVQKLTEIGATEIAFMECERSVVRWPADRAARQRERLERIAREAAMQSRRVWLPSVTVGESFAHAVTRPGAAVADPDGVPLEDVQPAAVLIGPEGGFSPAELAATVPRVALTHYVLRVETAAVVAATLLVARR